MRPRGALLGLVVYLACGCGPGSFAKDHVGEPVLEVSAQVTGNLRSIEDARDLRAAVVWTSFGPEYAAHCSERDSYYLPLCLQLWDEGVVLGVQEAVVSESVVERLTVRLFELPAVPSWGGGVFGIGTLVLYSDSNGSGAFELTAYGSRDPVDIVLGATDDETEWLLYREGDLIDNVANWDGCAEIPAGFSAKFLRGACLITRDDFVLQVETAQSSAQTFCEKPPLGFSPRRAPPRDDPDVAGDGQCSPDGREYTVDQHPEWYCGDWVTYTLVDWKDGQWDLSAAPPSWWPCEVL